MHIFCINPIGAQSLKSQLIEIILPVVDDAEEYRHRITCCMMYEVLLSVYNDIYVLYNLFYHFFFSNALDFPTTCSVDESYDDLTERSGELGCCVHA